jgi:CheY-like chemotaxis protein
LHGGTIGAESAGAGQGSTFTVTLPATTTPPPRETAAPAKPTASKPHRILLVDDNVDFATSMSSLLQGMGHEVRIAHNAAEALEIARELRPDLGFLDLGLPDKSGYELATELRAHPETAATVLVAVSGWGQPRDRERTRNAGFALHLVKPVELQSIRAAIETLVQDA